MQVRALKSRGNKKKSMPTPGKPGNRKVLGQKPLRDRAANTVIGSDARTAATKALTDKPLGHEPPSVVPIERWRRTKAFGRAIKKPFLAMGRGIQTTWNKLPTIRKKKSVAKTAQSAPPALAPAPADETAAANALFDKSKPAANKPAKKTNRRTFAQIPEPAQKEAKHTFRVILSQMGELAASKNAPAEFIAQCKRLKIEPVMAAKNYILELARSNHPTWKTARTILLTNIAEVADRTQNIPKTREYAKKAALQAIAHVMSRAKLPK